MDPVVLDAGHGGSQLEGSSTPIGQVGPAGTQEKDLTLAVARRTRDALAAKGIGVLLTREDDENPSLRERTFLSRSEDARAFISVHFNSDTLGPRGCEAWVHDRASGNSRSLAKAVLDELGEVSGRAAEAPLEGPLAVLDPRFHPPGTAACLIEVTQLGDASEEARLRQADYLESLADALARGVVAGLPEPDDRGAFRLHAVQEDFDIWHEVPLVQQLTGMSCWAAAAAMLVGWRDCIDIDAEEVAHGSGRWEAYRDGLTPEDVQGLADAWELTVEPPRLYSVAALRKLLEERGPLWVGEASPGLHVVVITGLAGDGTPDGTRVRIADPWPVGRGERYSISFAQLQDNLETAAGISGIPAQVLHTGGRGRSRTLLASSRYALPISRKSGESVQAARAATQAPRP
jgi:N-acetylmuramoyl-L-alanine amidase